MRAQAVRVADEPGEPRAELAFNAGAPTSLPSGTDVTDVAGRARAISVVARRRGTGSRRERRRARQHLRSVSRFLRA
jgi:hypothetical protein